VTAFNDQRILAVVFLKWSTHPMLVRLLLLALRDSGPLLPCAMAASCRSSKLFCSNSWLHCRTAVLDDESSCRSCFSSRELMPLRSELSSLVTNNEENLYLGQPMITKNIQEKININPHWARVLGYGPFSLCKIHKEGLCSSSGDINKLMKKNQQYQNGPHTKTQHKLVNKSALAFHRSRLEI
jgi:hypothetical protein